MGYESTTPDSEEVSPVQTQSASSSYSACHGHQGTFLKVRSTILELRHTSQEGATRPMQETWTRRATPDDASWIVDLSARVQDSLTARGSLQQIGPLRLESTEQSILTGNAFVLETGEKRLGSALVDPLEFFQVEQWALKRQPRPWWYLHSLMLEPVEQGKTLGIAFLEEVQRLMAPLSGTIVLDCWAGNSKLHDFYQRSGFTAHGVFPVQDYEVMVFVYSLAASSRSRTRF
jgi:GNAT superfamily N-acetyltransferase